MGRGLSPRLSNGRMDDFELHRLVYSKLAHVLMMNERRATQPIYAFILKLCRETLALDWRVGPFVVVNGDVDTSAISTV